MTSRRILYGLMTAVILSIACDFETFGMSATSAAQKGAVLVIILTNGFRARGPSVVVNLPNILILWAVGLSSGFGAGEGGLSAVESAARALVLLLTITAILRGSMDLGAPFDRSLLRTIQWLPLACVVIGLALIPWGVPIGRVEGGVFRISGASSPAHLAMLCCAAIAASSLLFVMDERSARPGFALIAFVLLILTGARTALIVGLMVGLPLMAYFTRIRSVTRLIAAIAVATVTPAIVFIGFQRLVARTFDSGGEVVTSGRDIAWSFFYERYLESPWFGHGLGASLNMRLLSSDYRMQFFHVPHNEYLRYLVDLGGIGLSLMMMSQIVLFLWAGRRIPFKSWFVAAALAHAFLAYFDNVYGTLQYLPFLMTIGVAIGGPVNRVRRKRKEPANLRPHGDAAMHGSDQGAAHA